MIDRIIVHPDARQTGPEQEHHTTGFWRWLPILGPTSTLVHQWLCTHTEALGPHEYLELELASWAPYFGVQTHLIRKSLDRLADFHCATWLAVDVFAPRLYFPVMNASKIERLPIDLRPVPA